MARARQRNGKETGVETPDEFREKMLGFVGLLKGGDPDGSERHDDLIYGPASEADVDTPRLGTVYLVSCVSKKKAGPLPAMELYASDWFKKAREYVERSRRPWYILSAEHGLLNPYMVISAYNKTLKRMSVGERRAWAERVWEKLKHIVAHADRIVMLAGQDYRRFLEDRIRATGVEVIVPMDGLRIGEQLQWLKKELSKHG